MAETKKSILLADRELSFSTGLVAKQANGSVLAQYGDTVILATFVHKDLPAEMKGGDFVSLMVDYRERTYAAGKIPGGFFKRENKPKDSEILASRLIDRPIRPLFPNNIGKDLSLNVLVLSYDLENSADILGIIGSSMAITLTGLPFGGPIGAVRIGYIDGNFVVNPNEKIMPQSLLDLVVVGTENKITMIESNSQELSEEKMVEALRIAQEEIKKVVQFQKDFANELGIQKIQIEEENNIDILKFVEEIYFNKSSEIKDVLMIFEKLKREKALADFKESLKSLDMFLGIDEESRDAIISMVYEKLIQKSFRDLITKDKKRPDGRNLDEIRPITCQVGILPSRVHGSSLFTRGETQSLGTVTLGNPKDEQILDELSGEIKKRFMLHYNFPSFSVGETKGSRGPGRREIGHGNLAEKALEKVLPSAAEFPYTIRVVSDILESNGSSSQASICAGCLALMHAGVPIKEIVAGISIGLVEENDNSTLLVDIAGLEDHFGDMDFKVGGTKNGITAIQMDLKVEGIKLELIPQILELAKVSRYKILDIMKETISNPNKNISEFAPKMEQFTIAKDKIRIVIGAGGQNIKGIIEKTKAEINIKDDGEVFISAVDSKACEEAKKMVLLYAEDCKVGEVYDVKIVKIMNFGAFAEIIPGKEGLIHISQLANKRVAKVEDVVNEGDIVKVKVIGVDDAGKISLSMKD
jgi:polyribonucleotide nucleotidyltransferase